MADYLSQVRVDGHLVAVVQQRSDVGMKEEMAKLFELDTIQQEQSKESEIDQVIKAMQKNSTMDKEWHNSDLGKAYSKGQLQLSADGILRFVNYRSRATQNHQTGVAVGTTKPLRRRLLLCTMCLCQVIWNMHEHGRELVEQLGGLV